MVGADIPDFQTMATDEDMAISFYKTGDAQDLAAKLSAVLESPELQHRMYAQNLSAAVRMTMPNVVRRYIRWFALAERKRALAAMPELQPVRRWSFTGWRSSALSLSGEGSRPETSVEAD